MTDTIGSDLMVYFFLLMLLEKEILLKQGIVQYISHRVQSVRESAQNVKNKFTFSKLSNL